MQIKAFESLWNFEKIYAILKQIEYLAFLTDVCIFMLWMTPATRGVVVRFFQLFSTKLEDLPYDKNRSQRSPTNIIPWFKQ